jgi:hypothetical protein
MAPSSCLRPGRRTVRLAQVGLAVALLLAPATFAQGFPGCDSCSDGLVAHFTFDSTDHFNDASPNALHLTAVDGYTLPALVPGISGQAAGFSASQAVQTALTSALPSGDSNRTVSLWLRDPLAGAGAVLGWGSNSQIGGVAALSFSHPLCLFYFWGHFADSCASISWPTGAWWHFAVAIGEGGRRRRVFSMAALRQTPSGSPVACTAAPPAR